MLSVLMDLEAHMAKTEADSSAVTPVIAKNKEGLSRNISIDFFILVYILNYSSDKQKRN